jgi:hypothetical protein
MKPLRLRLALPGCYPLLWEFNTAHWRRDGTQHKRSNPRVFAATYLVIRSDPRRSGHDGPQSSTRRLWLYFRDGYSLHFDFFIDRRPVAP